MENLRRKKKLDKVKDKEHALIYCNNFNFKSFKVFKEKLVAVTLIKKSIKWNKPNYFGAAILDEGVNKTVKTTRHHERFKSVLFDKRKTIRAAMKTIKSENHVLSVEKVNKIALSPFDNKKYYAEDGIHSLAYVHYKNALKNIFPK